MKISDIFEDGYSSNDIEAIKHRVMNTEFWKDSIKTNNWLFHSSNKKFKDFLILDIDSGRSRKPKDTPNEVHEVVNALSYNKFGYKIRNGLFGYNNLKGVKYYGKGYVILPLDDTYTMFYNPDVLEFTEVYKNKLENGIDPYDITIEYIDGVEEIRTLPNTIVEVMVFGNWVILDLAIFDEMVNGNEI